MAKGRKRGSRNKGYFFRKGRGWFAKDQAGRFVPLTAEDGERLREKDTPDKILRESHARFLLTTPEQTSGMAFQELAERYLANIKRDKGAESTRETRADFLFDLCYGYGRKWRLATAEPTAMDRIHPGYGELAAEEFRPYHVHEWLEKHPGWGAGTARLAIQAVKRVLNYGTNSGLIERNGLKGMSVPAAGARITCLNPDQEQALFDESGPPLSEALQILIRTGMRPMEFAQLAGRHVYDMGERMELRFRADEIKTRP